ncbi:hypothetical protein Tco_0180603 [Tanacetum coccineum]
MEILLGPTSNKLSVGKIVTNRFTHIVKSALRRSDIENKLAWLVLTEPEDSYKDGDGDTLLQLNLPSRYQDYQDKDYQGGLLASFLDDAKYEHVGQDTRSQDGKDDQDKQGKYLKISKSKMKSKDNDKVSRSKITKHEGTSLQRRQRQRSQEFNDKSNLIDLTKECHNELTSREIVSLKY